EVLVEVVAGGIVLIPAAATVAKGLVLGELLPRRGPRFRGLGLRQEAEPAQSGHGADNLQKIAAADADRRETLFEQVQLLIRNTHRFHPPVKGSAHFILGSRASRTPSPKNVNDSMVIAMAIDGKTQRYQ